MKKLILILCLMLSSVAHSTDSLKVGDIVQNIHRNFVLEPSTLQQMETLLSSKADRYQNSAFWTMTAAGCTITLELEKNHRIKNIEINIPVKKQFTLKKLEALYSKKWRIIKSGKHSLIKFPEQVSNSGKNTRIFTTLYFPVNKLVNSSQQIVTRIKFRQ